MDPDLLQYDFYWVILQSERRKEEELKSPKRRIRNMHQEEHHRGAPLFCVIILV